MLSLAHPDGFTVYDTYSSGLDSAISRLSSLSDGSYTLESYKYLGVGTIVQRSRPQPNVNLTYMASDSAATSNPTNTGGDRYTGLDQFGRVVDQNWVNPTTGVSTDRFQYGYDRNGNVLYKNNLLGSTFSELYHANSSSSGDNNSAYDPLNRLSGFRRGTLSASGHNGTGNF